MDHITLGENTSLSRSIVASGVTLAEGVTLFHNVVGESCHITKTPPPDTALSMQDGKLVATPMPCKSKQLIV